MAAAHSATAVFHFPAARKPPALSFSFSTRFPPQLTKFKNYPQTKIFNTLPKPLSNTQTPELTPTNPSIPADSPLPQQTAGTEVTISVPIEQQPVAEVKVSVPIEQQPTSEPSSQSNSPSDQSSEGLNGFEPVEKQPSDQFSGKETKEFVPVEQKRSRFDIYRYLNEKIEEAEEREYSYWQSLGSPQTGIEFAGNKFSIPSIVQIGFSFIAAIVFDLVWSISMARKLDAMTKEKEGKSDINGRKNTTIWERWAERKRKRNEVKNEGNVAIDESTMDKKIVETQDLAKKAQEEEILGFKGNDVKNEGNVDFDKSAMDKKIVETRELAKEAKKEENLGSKGNGSNEDDHVLESKIKKDS